ncbi:hypothetical protein SCLCIDRAFT_1207673 [Scleroderma citrinum Foug A]|uniref:Aminoglycoside phosphotransferase domain-containing protein n=1 Tax=Scleroderma citrinum Foug A TaxID=1036808 RepID=A0A0C3ER83_9AGAM|nr:hypothetical protein SCLCIDRAFT_1207673 [Scleroderma citrinum Foug A]
MSTFILKYAPPYVAAAADSIPVPFSPDRQKFEAEALRLANMIPRPNDANTVIVPTLRLLDQESHVMIIEDAGSDLRALKEILIDESLPGPVLEEIGATLGRYLAHIHKWNEHPDVDLTLFANNEAGKMVLTLMIYSRLVSTLTGEDRLPHLLNPTLAIPEEKLAAISKLAEMRTNEIYSSTASGVMTHGDYWPGNILVSLRRGAGGVIEALDRLYVLDWELAMTGLPGLDLGQYCAELFFIARAHPHREESVKTMVKSFLCAYRQRRKIDLATVRVVAGHMGAHVAVWAPRDPGDRDRTREVVQEGVELLDLSWSGSESSLLDSIVGPLLSG